MKNVKVDNKTDFDATIRLNDGQSWSVEEKALLDEHVQKRHSQRKPGTHQQQSGAGDTPPAGGLATPRCP